MCIPGNHHQIKLMKTSIIPNSFLVFFWSYSLSPSVPGNHWLAVCPYRLDWILYKCNHMVSHFIGLASFTLHDFEQFTHVVVCINSSFFLMLSNILLHRYPIICLPIQLLMDTGVVSRIAPVLLVKTIGHICLGLILN